MDSTKDYIKRYLSAIDAEEYDALEEICEVFHDKDGKFKSYSNLHLLERKTAILERANKAANEHTTKMMEELRAYAASLPPIQVVLNGVVQQPATDVMITLDDLGI